MGPLGWQEIAFIFLLALLLFGPKKLPELGKHLAKGLAEFRRAQSELKSTFEREMRSLERENESLKEVTSSYRYDTHNNYNYEYSSYDSGYNSESHDSTATTAVTTASASAPQGAELTSGAVPEGAIASGSLAAAGTESSTATAVEPGVSESGGPSHPESESPADEHQALKT
jgi:TatA/E family protein of Tat protein translocase